MLHKYFVKNTTVGFSPFHFNCGKYIFMSFIILTHTALRNEWLVSPTRATPPVTSGLCRACGCVDHSWQCLFRLLSPTFPREKDRWGSGGRKRGNIMNVKPWQELVEELWSDRQVCTVYYQQFTIKFSAEKTTFLSPVNILGTTAELGRLVGVWMRLSWIKKRFVDRVRSECHPFLLLSPREREERSSMARDLR